MNHTPVGTKSGAAASWNLVALGDSTPAGAGVGERSYVAYYAEYIEADLGVCVAVRNWARNGATTGDLLARIRGDPQVRDHLRAARVITLWVGWNDIIPLVGLN